MEVFKRFRSRRKSRGQADSFTSFADAESNYRSTTSPWRSSGRSSTTAPRPSDVTAIQKISTDQSLRLVSPIEQKPPGSSGRVQPMLMSISRPSTTISRPGTAESMQLALDRAADSVKRQQTPKTAASPLSSSPFSSHTPKASRHIDILTLSGSVGATATSFNEDIASRNLDLGMTTNGEQSQYEPTSKYQEEVAARNAHQIAGERRSSAQKPVSDERTKSIDSRSGGWSQAYTHKTYGKDALRGRRSQDVADQHTRTSSTRTRENGSALPMIPQERSSEDFGTQEEADQVRQAEQELEKAKARWLEARRQNRSDKPVDIDKPLPASPRRNNFMRDSGIATYPEPHHAKTDSEATGHHQPHRSRQDSLQSITKTPNRKPEPDLYQVVSNETTASQDRNSDGQVYRRDRASDNSRYGRSLRPSSNSSNPPGYKRVTRGNRTIMDLTGEEDPEARSVVSYMQTPVIENAHVDAVQKVMPTFIDNSGPLRVPERDAVVPNSRWSSAQEPVLDLDQLARRSQAIAEAARVFAEAQPPAHLETPRATAAAPPPKKSPLRKQPAALSFSTIQTLTSSPPPKVITFSPINTLTSTSPRSSQEILPVPNSIVETEREPTSIPTPAAEVRKASSRISANIAPLVKVFADVQPDESRNLRHETTSKPTAIRKVSSDKMSTSDTNKSSKKEGKRRERSTEKDAIRIAAKSIIPAGPLDQEPTPEVKTRDFALMPVEKPTNKRIEALAERKRSPLELKKPSKENLSSSKSSSSEKKKSTKSAKAAGKAVEVDPVTSSTTTVQKTSRKREKSPSKDKKKKSSKAKQNIRPASKFDDEAYLKKHAEANAALLRLQQSLQESFDLDMPSDATRDTATPLDRALSPADSVMRSGTPMLQGSPAAAAMAMINAATNSPRSSTPKASGVPNLHTKASSDLTQPRRDNRPLAAQRSITDSIAPTFAGHGNIFPMQAAVNPVFARIDANNKPPPSPGEVSLSAFPIPTPRAHSPEENRSPPAYVKDVGMPVRRGSQASRMSSSSQFSIPVGMLPSRLASLPENRMSIPGPPNPPQMESLNAMIPPTQRITT